MARNNEKRHLSCQSQQPLKMKNILLVVLIVVVISSCAVVQARSCISKPICGYVRGQLRVTPFASECDFYKADIVQAIDGVRYNPTTKQCESCSEIKTPLCAKKPSSDSLTVFYSQCDILAAGYIQETSAVVDKCGKCVKCDYKQTNNKCGIDPETFQVKAYSSECDMYLAGAFPTTRTCTTSTCNPNSGPKCGVDSVGLLRQKAFASECDVIFNGYTVATGNLFALDTTNMKCYECGDRAQPDDKKPQCGYSSNKIIAKPYQNLCDLLNAKVDEADGNNGRPYAVVSGSCNECIQCNNRNTQPTCGVAPHDATIVPYATECDLIQNGAVPVDVNKAYYDKTLKRCVFCDEATPDTPLCGEVNGVVRSDPFNNKCEMAAVGAVISTRAAYDSRYRICSECTSNDPVCGKLNNTIQVFGNECEMKSAGASIVDNTAYNPQTKACETCQTNDGKVCGKLAPTDTTMQIYSSSCARTMAGATSANAVVDSCGKCVTCSKDPVTYCGFDLDQLKNVKYVNQCEFFKSGSYPVPATLCK
jgi:hypothetical protein